MYFRMIEKFFRWIRYPQYIMFLLEGCFLLLSFSIDNNLFYTKISTLRYFFLTFFISAFKLSPTSLLQSLVLELVWIMEVKTSNLIQIN